MIKTMVITLLLVGVIPAKGADGGSFKNCATWLNNQVEFEVAGQRSSDKLLQMNDDGTYATSSDKQNFSCVDCLPKVKNQTRIEFAEDTAIKNWLETHPKDKGPSDFKDVIKITRDDQGRIANVLVDSVTGGRGAFINGTHYLYFHRATSYDFKYDKKGCYPSNNKWWNYVGNDKEKPEELFDMVKCKEFDSLWSQLKFEDKKRDDGTTQYWLGTKIPFRAPVLPPPEALRGKLANSILSIQSLTEEAQKEVKNLAVTTWTDRKTKEDWDLFLNMARRKCVGLTGDREAGPTNVRSFVEARRQDQSGSQVTNPEVKVLK